MIGTAPVLSPSHLSSRSAEEITFLLVKNQKIALSIIQPEVIRDRCNIVINLLL